MKQKDIILVPFPFSDQSGQKIRPALIISNNSFNDVSKDIIVCAVTSNIKTGKYSVPIDQNDIENGVLYEKSIIKSESIFKIQKSLVIKNVARIKKTAFSKVVSSIIELIKGETGEETIVSEES